MSPEELQLWRMAVAAYAVAFGPVLEAVEKAADVVLAVRYLKPGDLSTEAATMLIQARGGR